METHPPFWFLEELHSISLRLKVKYRRWEAEPEDQAGEQVWPVAGPPILRASNSTGDVGIKLVFGKQDWVKMHPDRVTSGRFCIFEEIDGESHKLFDLCDFDSGPMGFDRRTLVAIRERCFDIDGLMELRRKEEAKLTEHEIDPHGGGPPVPVKRNAEQRQARDDSEQLVKEFESHMYNRDHAKYQFDPSLEPKGEKRQGFTVIDRRAPRGN